VPDLTVMTWNIQNLFPVGHPDGPATQQEYDGKIAGLAGVINAVEPDVLALQEVGPEHVLADLNAACRIDFDHRLAGGPDGRGIRVALLSPRLLSNRVDITTFPGNLPGRPRAHSCRLGATDPLARLGRQRRSRRQVLASTRAALRIHCAAPPPTVVGECDHHKSSKCVDRYLFGFLPRASIWHVNPGQLLLRPTRQRDAKASGDDGGMPSQPGSPARQPVLLHRRVAYFRGTAPLRPAGRNGLADRAG
jgi:hypothetical protein